MPRKRFSGARAIVVGTALCALVVALGAAVLFDSPQGPAVTSHEQLEHPRPIPNNVTDTTRPEGPGAATTLPALEATLTTKNASSRSGYIFAPARGPDEVLPLLVALHGQGGDGHELVAVFKSLAAERRFAIVAPSSNYTEQLPAFTWTVGDKPNDFTTDFHHIAACVSETLARTDIRLDASHVLIAGYSGGGSSAPYIASNTPSYEAFAVLHGGVFIGGIGPRRVPGWFSAGTMDPIRPAQGVMEHAQSLRAAGFAVTYRSYPSTHVVSEQELADLVEWWFALRS